METFKLLRQKVDHFITAIGGKIEGISPLPPDETAAVRRRALYCSAFTILGFLFESTPTLWDKISVNPSGIALLFAAGHSSTLFVGLGALAGILVSGELIFPRLVLTCLILFCRYALSGGVFFEADCKTFGEPVKPRLILSAIFAFFRGICTLVVDGLTLSGILSLVLGSILAPLLTAALVFAFDRSRKAALHEAGEVVLIYLLVSSLENGSVYGLTLSLIVAYLLLLHTAHSAGMLRGMLIGLVCGLACGDYAIILALAGFAAGAILPFGMGVSLFVSAALAIGVAIYSGAAHIVHFAGDVIFVSLIYLPLTKAGILRKIRLFGKDPESVVWLTDPAAERRLSQERKRRLSALSSAFDEISELLLGLSSELRNPRSGKLRELCDDVFDRNCRRCALASVCWQSGYDETTEAIGELCERLSEKNPLDFDDFPEKLRKKCRHADRILREINRGRAELIESAITKDKTDLFAMDYAAIAELLRENSESDAVLAARFAPDETLRATAEQLVRSLGIGCISVGAFGDRQKSVVVSGVEVASVTVSGRQIASELSKAAGIRFGEPDFRFRGDYVVMTLVGKPTYRLETAGVSQSRKGEEVCGDQLRTFCGSGSYGYCLICDGMGSGSDASAVAEIGAIFLQKMLTAGNSRSVSIKLLSSLICARAVECSTTVDLLEVDLFTGKAVFEKAGAAPSYIYRSGKLFKVDSKTMPIGVVKDPAPEDTQVQLMVGDLIVMVSDGVAASIECAQWLPEMIAKGAKSEAGELAASIKARAAHENRGADDISVVVAKVQ